MPFILGIFGALFILIGLIGAVSTSLLIAPTMGVLAALGFVMIGIGGVIEAIRSLASRISAVDKPPATEQTTSSGDPIAS